MTSFISVTKPQQAMLDVVTKNPEKTACELGRLLWGGKNPSKGASYVRTAMTVLRNLQRKKLVHCFSVGRDQWGSLLWVATEPKGTQ